VSDSARIAENPAPYDVLTSRQALLEAAKLNIDALAIVAVVQDGDVSEDSLDVAVQYAQVAQSLSTYADALTRWMTS
jgi:hypothetical protein